jgi:hypothetical protein
MFARVAPALVATFWQQSRMNTGDLEWCDCAEIVVEQIRVGIERDFRRLVSEHPPQGEDVAPGRPIATRTYASNHPG